MSALPQHSGRSFILTYVGLVACFVDYFAARADSHDPRIIGEGSLYPVLERPSLFPSTAPKDMHAIMQKEMQAQNLEIVVEDEPPTAGAGGMAGAAAAAVAAVGGELTCCLLPDSLPVFPMESFLLNNCCCMRPSEIICWKK